MERYISNKKGKKIILYSIGEKIYYYKKRIKNNTLSAQQQNWAKIRLNQLKQLKTNNNSLGDVFLINDSLIGAPKKFGRRVVVGYQYNDFVGIYPIKKRKLNNYNRFMVQNFDGNRDIDLDIITNLLNDPKNRELNLDDLYEKYMVHGTDNDYLTDDEKLKLGFIK